MSDQTLAAVLALGAGGVVLACGAPYGFAVLTAGAVYLACKLLAGG